MVATTPHPQVCLPNWPSKGIVCSIYLYHLPVYSSTCPGSLWSLLPPRSETWISTSPDTWFFICLRVCRKCTCSSVSHCLFGDSLSFRLVPFGVFRHFDVCPQKGARSTLYSLVTSDGCFHRHQDNYTIFPVTRKWPLLWLSSSHASCLAHLDCV